MGGIFNHHQSICWAEQKFYRRRIQYSYPWIVHTWHVSKLLWYSILCGLIIALCLLWHTGLTWKRLFVIARGFSFIWVLSPLEPPAAPRHFGTSLPFSTELSAFTKGLSRCFLFFNQQTSTILEYKIGNIFWIMCVKECEKVFWRGVFKDYIFIHNKSFLKYKWMALKRWPVMAVDILLCFLNDALFCVWLDLCESENLNNPFSTSGW